MKTKTYKCKECGNKFEKKHSTLQKVCSLNCAIKQGKKNAPKEIKKAESLDRKQKLERKKQLAEKYGICLTKKSPEQRLQEEINTIIRLIDKGHSCISSRRSLGKKYDAGHFWSVGSNIQLRYHLDNIYAQSVYSNRHKSGDEANYILGLTSDFGIEHTERVLNLKNEIKTLKLMDFEIEEKITIAKQIVKELKDEARYYSNVERLELRNKYNKRLDIYKL